MGIAAAIVAARFSATRISSRKCNPSNLFCLSFNGKPELYQSKSTTDESILLRHSAQNNIALPQRDRSYATYKSTCNLINTTRRLQ
jgi:hypothetical protein